MCTGIVETVEVSGSGKGPHGWFKLEQVTVSYDHPTDAQLEHALNIDFVNEKEGPNARVAVELSPESASRLVRAILAAMSQAATVVIDSSNRTSPGDDLRIKHHLSCDTDSKSTKTRPSVESIDQQRRELLVHSERALASIWRCAVADGACLPA